MALYWDFKNKVGEAFIQQTLPDRPVKEFTVNLYEGNAYLIFVNEYEENGKNMYSLYTFFADELHAKRCLGLDKEYGTENMFTSGYEKLVTLRINKAKYKKVNKLISLFTKAFDEITIEIYKED